MSRPSLNPDGGRSERIIVSTPHALVDRIDRLADLHGFPTRSAYLRAKVEQLIEAEEAELFGKEKSKAS